jgi:hypothetical protein
MFYQVHSDSQIPESGSVMFLQILRDSIRFFMTQKLQMSQFYIVLLHSTLFFDILETQALMSQNYTFTI